MHEQVERLLREVSETKGQNASILKFIKGVPMLIRNAVDEALAANPSLTPEDLAAFTAAADDLDNGQQEISAAIEENSSSSEGDGNSEDVVSGDVVSSVDVEPEEESTI